MSAVVRLPLDYFGFSKTNPVIAVELDDDGARTVCLSFELEPSEADPASERIHRSLTPGESRALAAALCHFAGEAER